MEREKNGRSVDSFTPSTRPADWHSSMTGRQKKKKMMKLHSSVCLYTIITQCTSTDTHKCEIDKGIARSVSDPVDRKLSTQFANGLNTNDGGELMTT